jgi:uncharacterized membrane protein
MESKAKVLGHSAHQMMIVFPLGLLATGVIFDVIHLVTGNGTMALVAYYMISAGLIGGLIAAPLGTIDWLAIPRGTRAKAVGITHGLTNALVLVAFFVSWLVRRGNPQDPETMASILSLVGAGLALVGGWLGGELVARLGVGVDDGAHLDSPSSLSGRPASDRVVPQTWRGLGSKRSVP